MHSSASLPLVTLGIPVCNEGEFLAEALENLLGQDYPHIEIIIADNGSTDDTQKICEEYAAKHSNITYVRHPKNLGQHTNFNYLPHCASGKYFCWASGHDLLAPTFVTDCVKVLESDANIVLAYPHTMNMKKDGTHTGEKVRPFDIRHKPAGKRFREVMWRVDCNVVYGMWRLIPMLESNLFQLLPAPDRVFLAEMAAKGSFAAVETFRYSRANRGGPQPEMEKRHRIMKYLYPHRTFTDAEIGGNDLYAPTMRGFRRVVDDSTFPWLARRYAYFSVWMCGVVKFHLFPGADAMSVIVKKILPSKLLKLVMRKMT